VISLAQRLAFPGEASYVSSPTATSVQFLIHTRVLPSGALACTRVLVDPWAIHDVEFDESSRTRLRDEFARVLRELKVRMAPAPGAYVAARIHAAMAAHTLAGKTLGLNAAKAIAMVPKPDGDVPHPSLALGPIADAAARVERSLNLHAEPEVNPLLPSKEEIEAVGDYVAKHGASGDEPTVTVGFVDPTLAALRAGMNAACGRPTLDRLALQLRDVALVFATTRRPELALDAVAVADALDAAGDGGVAPDQVPFVFGLFYKFALVQREYAKAQATAR
jgi:hypothetical protein